MVMDLYSRYPEVHVAKSTGMANIRPFMDQIMRTHGAPEEIRSDGGPPYNGHEWDEWVESWGAKPRKTTPYHPPANGMVERFNRNLKMVLHAAFAEGKDEVEEVHKYVANYRNTPHSITGEKPTKLLFNRDVKTKLPSQTTRSIGKKRKRDTTRKGERGWWRSK